MRLSPATLIAAFFLSGSTTRLWPGPLPRPGIVWVTATDFGSIARACTWSLGKSYVQIRAPSQYVCSSDNQRTEAPSGRVSRTWRLATSISVTSLEPTLKTYTVSRPSAPPAAVADCAGAELVCEALPLLPLVPPAEGDEAGPDDPQAAAMSPSAALLAPLRTVRRSRLDDRNQSEPPTNTPFASPREAQSSGAQCEGGWADASGFTIAFDIARLLQAHDLHSTPRESAEIACPSSSFRHTPTRCDGNLLPHRRSSPGRLLCGRGAAAVIPVPRKREDGVHMAHWLLKSEPDEWSWTQQVAEGRDGAEWTGIRNFSARNHLRAMKNGEQAFFYHTGKERAIVGIVKVIAEAHPDSTDSAWSAVDVAAVRPLSTPVGLDQIKANKRLAGMALVRLARLSVQPVTEAEWRIVCQMGGL